MQHLSSPKNIECRCIIYVVFIVASVLVSVISTSAPEDADFFCSNATQGSSSTPPPVYPANSRVLMDSYHYINLLPPHVGPAWQMVDNDNNNLPGRGTEWTQNTNFPCRQSAVVCGFSVGPQNNWLITQHIRRTARNFARVSVLVEFELRRCDSVTCRRTFVLYKYESSELNDGDVRDISRFQQAAIVVAEDDTGQIRQNRTVELTLDTVEDGFYLAIVDETTCIGVTRVLVFYNVCPGGLVDFVDRPETLAPRFERLSQPTTVLVQCVEGASSETGDLALLYCNQGGDWTPISGSGCHCNPGFLPSEDRQTCKECPAGTYPSSIHQVCRDCPANSESFVPGVDVCPCVEGYYRAPGEEDLECTQPPSEPRNLVITSTTSTSISLAWDPPESLGGRNDTRYSLWYQEEGSGNRVRVGTTNDTVRTVTGLCTCTKKYTAYVSAINGVSGLSMESNIPATSTTEVQSCGNQMANTITSAVLAIVAVSVIMAFVLAMTILHYKRKMQRLLDSHPVQAPVYETMAPKQTPIVGSLRQRATHMEVLEAEDNACYMQNIAAKENLAYEKTRVEQTEEEEECTTEYA